MTIDELPAAFAAARTTASGAARFAPGKAPAHTCRYCGEFWSYYGASNNDGHAVCIVPEEFRRAVEKMWRYSPTLNMQTIAGVCGVSKKTINAWIHGARRKRRGDG